MDYLEIHGGHPLSGEVKISGEERDVAIDAATLLTEETVRLRGFLIDWSMFKP